MAGKLEPRYLVFKLKDADEFLSPKQKQDLVEISHDINLGRVKQGRGNIQGVFVESHCSVYEVVLNLMNLTNPTEV